MTFVVKPVTLTQWKLFLWISFKYGFQILFGIKNFNTASFLRKDDFRIGHNDRNSFVVPNDIKLLSNIISFILCIFIHVPRKYCVLILSLIHCDCYNILIASCHYRFDMRFMVFVFNCEFQRFQIGGMVVKSWI